MPSLIPAFVAEETEASRVKWFVQTCIDQIELPRP